MADVEKSELVISSQKAFHVGVCSQLKKCFFKRQAFPHNSSSGVDWRSLLGSSALKSLPSRSQTHPLVLASFLQTAEFTDLSASGNV